MKQNGSVLIITLVFLLVITGVGSFYYFSKQSNKVSTSKTQEINTPNKPDDSNWVELDISGYQHSCTTPKIYKKEHVTWERVQGPIGPYYLDGMKYFDRGCHILEICEKTSAPGVDLIEYKKIGEKIYTDSEGAAIPEYTTSPLTGEIKIEYSYFSDQECKIPKTYSTIINK